MLTRQLSIRQGQQTVTFKFLPKRDVQGPLTYQRAVARLEEIRERVEFFMQDVGGEHEVEFEKLEVERKQLVKFTKKVDSMPSLEQLETSRYAQVLHNAFCEARRAAVALEGLARKLTGNITQVTTPEAVIVKRFFPVVAFDDVEEVNMRILDVATKTAAGLSSNGITISDNAGRDQTGTGPVEGIVRTKTQFRPMRDRLRQLTQDYLDDAEFIGKWLEYGLTNNIRIEFSLARTMSVSGLARVILHEATHKFAATTDHAYRDQAYSLPSKKAMNNADTYAWMGISLLRGRVVTSNELTTEASRVRSGDQVDPGLQSIGDLQKTVTRVQ